MRNEDSPDSAGLMHTAAVLPRPFRRSKLWASPRAECVPVSSGLCERRLRPRVSCLPLSSSTTVSNTAPSLLLPPPKPFPIALTHSHGRWLPPVGSPGPRPSHFIDTPPTTPPPPPLPPPPPP